MTGRARTPSETIDQAYNNLGFSFQLAYAQLFSKNDVPPIIFANLENLITDFESSALHDYEHGQLISACAATILHLRQRHTQTGAAYSPEMINFMNRAVRYVMVGAEYLSDHDNTLSKTSAKDSELVDAVVPKWIDTFDLAGQRIASIKQIQADLYRHCMTGRAGDYADSWKILDPITEYRPPALDSVSLNKRSGELKSIWQVENTIAPAGIKALCYAAFESLQDIIKIHDVLSAPIDADYAKWDCLAMFQTRQPIAGRSDNPHDRVRLFG